MHTIFINLNISQFFTNNHNIDEVTLETIVYCKPTAISSGVS
jgi:hypothetical protein